MARKNYTQLQDTRDRMAWMARIAKRMGLTPGAHRDRVRIYDFALAALCAGLTAVVHTPEPIRIDTEAETQSLTDPEPWGRDLSHHEYNRGAELYPQIAGNFIPVLTALMRDADTDNMERLAREFPVIAKMLQERYNAPSGVLPEVDGFTAEEWLAQEAEDGE